MLVPDGSELLGFMIQQVPRRETPIVRNSVLGAFASGKGPGLGIHPLEQQYTPNKKKKSRVIQLSAGQQGTKETLLKMKELALLGARTPQIWELSRKIVGGTQPCDVKDHQCEADRMLKWVQRNIRWTPDIGNAETVAAPWRTVEVRAGDCDDVSTLLASLALSIGMGSRFKAIAANSSYKDEFTHVYIELKVGNRWIPAEPSIKDVPLGWESPVIFKTMLETVWEDN